MLSFFRRGGGIAQVVLGAVVFTIIVVFVVEFRQGGRAQGRVKLECAVEVLGYCADLKEYQAAQALIIPPGADPKWVRQQQLERYTLEGLVERELLHREAERLGIEVSEQELDDELEQGRMHVSLPVRHAAVLSGRLGLCRLLDTRSAVCVPGTDLGVRLLRVTSSKTGQFDYKVYERTIRVTTNRGTKEFKAMQHRELVAERLRQLVRSRVRVSPEEAFQVYRRENSKAVARVVQIRRDWMARYVVNLSDQEVADWAAANQEQVKDLWEQEKEKFTAGCQLVSELMIAFSPDSSHDDKDAVRARAAEIARRLEAGEDFALLAREASALDSAALGGTAGCFQKTRYGEQDGKLLEQALGSARPGTVTPVIEGARGCYLLKAEGLLEEATRQQVGEQQLGRRLAVRFKADALAREFADQIIARVQGGATLEDATRELVEKYLSQGPWAKRSKEQHKAGLGPGAQAPGVPKVETTAPFTIVSSPFPGSLQPDAAVRLFELEPGKLLPTALGTTEGVAVAELKEKTQARREDFEKGKSELVASIRELKAQDALVSFVARLRSAAAERIKINQRLLEPGPKENAGEE